MSLKRALAAALFSTALVVPLAATSPSASGASMQQVGLPATPAAPGVLQNGTFYMLPQLAQPGSGTKKPSKAKSSMAALFRPIREGRTVVLQRQKDNSWVKVATRRQDARGMVQFNAPYKRNGDIQVYRAVTVEYQGLPATPTPAARTDKWGAPELSDTFRGRKLPDGWAHRDTSRTGFRKCAKSFKKSIKVRNGVLKLSVRKDPKRNRKCKTPYGKFDYRLTGQVATEDRREYLYGFAAARLKFQPRRGQHSAFWMQPGAADRTKAEIDIVEWFGEKHPNGGLTSFVHYTNANGHRVKSGGFVPDLGRYGKKWASKYHVFSVEWTRQRYVFRIDGKETFRTQAGVSHVREFLILSLQANTYEIPYLDGNKAAPHKSKRLPQQLSIDWVRYWEP